MTESHRRPPCADADPGTLDLALTAAVLRRRAWLVLGLPVLAFFSFLVRPAAPVSYEARLRVAIDIPRELIVPGSDEGTAAKIGEALVDDIARVIPSQAFAQAVAARLPAGTALAPGQIASELSATDRHRVADVWVRGTAAPDATAADVARLEAHLQAAAEAVVAELEQNGRQWFARLGEDNVALTVIDRPAVAPVAPSLRARLDLPLRLGLALVVGMGLALVWHALDARLYGAAEAEAATGAPVLARVPGRRRLWR